MAPNNHTAIRRSGAKGAAAAATTALLLALASAPVAVQAQPPWKAPFWMSGARVSNDHCSQGFMAGARVYRDNVAQARCPGPCLAVHWHQPLGDATCVLGYEVEVVSAEDGTKVTRKARATDTGVVVTGLKSTHNYKVKVTTKYSPQGTDTSEFEAMSSSD